MHIYEKERIEADAFREIQKVRENCMKEAGQLWQSHSTFTPQVDRIIEETERKLGKTAQKAMSDLAKGSRWIVKENFIDKGGPGGLKVNLKTERYKDDLEKAMKEAIDKYKEKAGPSSSTLAFGGRVASLSSHELYKEVVRSIRQNERRSDRFYLRPVYSEKHFIGRYRDGREFEWQLMDADDNEIKQTIFTNNELAMVASPLIAYLLLDGAIKKEWIYHE